jgi:hypothetical protein
MPRRSLRPNLNQIRAWVRQGRTDAWVAHQLEVTVKEIEQFKRQNKLASEEEAAQGLADYPEEIDLRAEDDALIAAELEAADRRAEEEETQHAQQEDEQEQPQQEGHSRLRRRSRRSARSRRDSRSEATHLEGTFDHGEEGYGLWLDPAIQENPIYAEHWAGHRPVEVIVEEDQIVIRRLSEEEP